MNTTNSSLIFYLSSPPSMAPHQSVQRLLQPLPQPIPQLCLPELRQIIHPLLTQINPLQLCHVLCRRLADPRHDDRGVCFEDNTIVYYLVDCEREEVVVLNYGALIH
jgi:hypothetical protein